MMHWSSGVGTFFGTTVISAGAAFHDLSLTPSLFRV